MNLTGTALYSVVWWVKSAAAGIRRINEWLLKKMWILYSGLNAKCTEEQE